MRITDPEGGANVGAIFYNFDYPIERHNRADTFKAEPFAQLTKGLVLHSDMFLSRLSPIRGGHDPLSGTSDRQLVEKNTVLQRTRKCATTSQKWPQRVPGQLAKWGLDSQH
jgi:uncharacterized protein YcgI (DUF1989 family)